MNEIINIYYANSERYGYRRIALELANRGLTVNHKKVKRLMSKMGLYALTSKAKYKSYRGDLNGVTANHLLRKVINETNNTIAFKRDFYTFGCNEVWLTDVSEFHIAAGKLYLSPIMDLNNREIVSYNISRSPNFNQTLDMLDKAFVKYDI